MGTVFITGGSGELGLETALLFAQKGHDVALSYQTNARSAKNGVKKIRKMGCEAIAIKMDIGYPNEVDRAFETVTQHFEKLDYLICNASQFNGFNPSRNQTWQMWERIMAVNLIGQWYCAKLALAEMTKTGGGSVVYNASLSGLIGVPYAADFVASKWALIGMAKSQALEYAAHHVRINVVCPGGLSTGLGNISREEEKIFSAGETIPVGRKGAPQGIAALIYWLAVENTYCYGTTLVADGGVTAGVLRLNGPVPVPLLVKRPEDKGDSAALFI